MILDKFPLMVSKLQLVFATTIVFLSFSGYAQNGYWKKEASASKLEASFSRKYDVQHGTVFEFDETGFKNGLMASKMGKDGPRTVYFPDRQGQMVAYEVTERPVLSPALSEKYPQLKSYAGQALDGSKRRVRFSISHKGIQSMVVAPNEAGASFMQKKPDGKYVLYSRKDNAKAYNDFICSTGEGFEQELHNLASKPLVAAQELRKFRLAVAASGGYTSFHGGTVADAMAAINATVTRINEVFETDLGITFELVPQNDQVIFTNAATDPFNPPNLSAQTQSTLTGTIGASNYDIGILFDKTATGGDGNAGFIGAVCVDTQKGSAYAGFVNPEGDIFDLDFVAHEMGHQFGANHTWSYENEGTEVQVEPGSGTTIMGYAGIAGNDNVASNGSDYFHYASIDQITTYIATTSCAQVISITNTAPVVTPLGGFTIPKSTAFVLTGSATDADLSDVLTYTWEQVDHGIVPRALFGPNNTVGANFRSLPPTTSPERYFPKLTSVLSGALTQVNPTINSAWETVSNVERDMNFAFTVRDNALGGGQVVSDLVNVFVTSSAGPFTVTSQDAAVTLSAGDVETVVWSVANTDQAPVNAKSVDILLSTDDGLTFPIVLANDVPNDGVHEVILPGVATNNARIMVKASDHIFFAVNSAFFSIALTEVVLAFDNLDYEICQPDPITVPFVYETYLGFDGEVTFSALDLPAGMVVSFSPATASANGTPIEMTILDTQNVAIGSYPINIRATSNSLVQQVGLTVNVFNTTFDTIALTAPLNGATNVSIKEPLSWETMAMATAYDVQISDDAAFTNIIESATTTTNTYVPQNLLNGQSYFWRVEPENSCGEGTFSPAFGFTTIDISCASEQASALPLSISASGTPTITSTLTFFEDLPVVDIKVSLELDHTFLSDLNITLTSPAGTVVTLVANSCNDLNNINAVFDDNAPDFVCGGSPAISGNVHPLGALNSFKGESILGEWVLNIKDLSPNDGGSLKAFAIEACVEGSFRPDDDNDGVFDDGDDLCPGTPAGVTVDATGCPIYFFPEDNFVITLKSESCRNSNDGAINITAVLPLAYTLTLSGNGVELNEAFSGTFSESSLTAGTYSLCIEAFDGDIIYEPYCADLVITEPDALSVTSKISLEGNVLELTLNGASLYNIELNGIITQTEASEISLDLKRGGNTLKVFTNVACHGSYEERIYVGDGAMLYPNPVVERANINFGTELERVNIRVFSSDGRMVLYKSLEVNSTETNFDLSGLAAGTYYLVMEGDRFKGTSKIIKL